MEFIFVVEKLIFKMKIKSETHTSGEYKASTTFPKSPLHIEKSVPKIGAQVQAKTGRTTEVDKKLVFS